ncbi:carbohydrate ABC transporter membrane protein 1 (CUT1 family) [Saccharothrix saharensis]|uniref:Carbohydrate ABC transporter membrane protein 1 (CUT1 family) n=1 Tax=Saccharothrix saharensis TaxID=571190 RepID=A0A543J7I3_9PSEU|nr:sugar ABC transporter permease [Saccharothrix saharensis]TQM78789.1 carbohydrate ABC transporter membrane protein 1 (CUT1 family) [Saccharothrix saharensis]
MARTLRQHDARTGLLLLTPTLVIVLAVVLVPLAWSVLIAFQRVRLIDVGRAGLFDELTSDNFARVLGSDVLWRSLRTTVAYTAGSTVLAIALGLVAALALRRPFPGRSFVRAAMLIPYVAPVVAVTFVWRVLLNPEFGIVNDWGRRLFGWDDPIAFLSQARGEVTLFGLDVPVPTALLTVIAFEGWRYFPFAFLFLLARLSALPGDVEEAATVDGATPAQRFRHIVLPQLMPVIAVLVVLRTIWTFNEFDDVFLLTGGAAGTEVVSVRVYELLTVQRNVGAAAAQSVLLAAVLVVLLGAYLWLLRRREGVRS